MANAESFFEEPPVPGHRGVSNTPHRRSREGRKQIHFLKGRTYPVGKLHRYFEGSHIPSCKGVLNTPHRKPRRGRKQIHFLKGHTYPVGELYRYFEGLHVPSRRGVSNTPHRRPRRERKRDIFRHRWWRLVGRMQYAPTLPADKDSINRDAFTTSNRQSQG